MHAIHSKKAHQLSLGREGEVVHPLSILVGMQPTVYSIVVDISYCVVSKQFPVLKSLKSADSTPS